MWSFFYLYDMSNKQYDFDNLYRLMISTQDRHQDLLNARIAKQIISGMGFFDFVDFLMSKRNACSEVEQMYPNLKDCTLYYRLGEIMFEFSAYHLQIKIQYLDILFNISFDHVNKDIYTESHHEYNYDEEQGYFEEMSRRRSICKLKIVHNEIRNYTVLSDDFILEPPF